MSEFIQEWGWHARAAMTAAILCFIFLILTIASGSLPPPQSKIGMLLGTTAAILAIAVPLIFIHWLWSGS